MKVKVCVGARCTMMGASGLMDGIEALKNEFFTNEVLEIEPVNCMNICKSESTVLAPVVSIDDKVFTNVNLQEISEVILQKANIIKE